MSDFCNREWRKYKKRETGAAAPAAEENLLLTPKTGVASSTHPPCWGSATQRARQIHFTHCYEQNDTWTFTKDFFVKKAILTACANASLVHINKKCPPNPSSLSRCSKNRKLGRLNFSLLVGWAFKGRNRQRMKTDSRTWAELQLSPNLNNC